MKRRKGSNNVDLVMAFSNQNTNADLDGLSGEEAHKRRVMAESIREAEEDRIKAEAAAKRAREVADGLAPTMDAIRAYDQQLDEQMGKRWRHSIASIRDMVDIHPATYAYRLADLPLISAEEIAKISFEDFRNSFHAFLVAKAKDGVTLDDEESKEKLALFAAVQSQRFEGKDVGVNPLALEFLEDCWSHLERWGAIKVTREAKPQAAPELGITDYTDAATDRAVVERDLNGIVIGDGGIADQWLASMAVPPFSFCPTPTQLESAVNLLKHRQLPLTDPESYNIVRRALVKAKVWPSHLLDKDERIAELCEQYSLSDPVQRRAFFQERNKILYDTE